MKAIYCFRRLGNSVRGHSQITLTRFWIFWPPTSLHLHFHWYESWQKVDIFGPPMTYLPRLVNLVCERPLSFLSYIYWSYQTYFWDIFWNLSGEKKLSIFTRNIKNFPSEYISNPMFRFLHMKRCNLLLICSTRSRVVQ